jgi:hypothetical protein
LKKEEKTLMLKALAPWKLMIACVWCMMFGDMLNLLLLRISDPTPRQGTHKKYFWDGWAFGVCIDDWGITHGWWSKQDVKCEDELGAIEETKRGKIDTVGIIGWEGGNVSWWCVQVITILVSDCDTYWCFDDGEITGLAMPIHSNEHSRKP